MADDWQAGDLALCVKAGDVLCPATGARHTGKTAPRVGFVGEVSHLSASIGTHGVWVGHRCGCTTVVFKDGCSGLVTRFRKIRPHTPDAEDAETIRLLRGAPVRVDA